MQNNIKKLKLHPEEVPLDDYEWELLEFIEKGKLVSEPNLDERKKFLKEVVKNYKEQQKTKSITLRVKSGDLVKIKEKALENNIPYQSLIGVLIKKYVNGETKIQL